MLPLIKVHKRYLVRKPFEEVAHYLTTLEESRKQFEADIKGGPIATEPPTFAFIIPVVAFTNIPTRTLVHATLHPAVDKTEVKVTLTPNIAFVLLALVGVIYIIVAFLREDSTGTLLKSLGSGGFILVLSCILDVISKKVVLGTFERCLRDIHKQHRPSISQTS
jgi:hypothetical protein